ncbi:hypothetical protein [Pelomonas sp. KK5]|uniref:hypothetical protein n=1 Tax=Pelomonas sp. KK5 TaxID=1855730 RepID=UPI00097C61AB|nr:hypothetical protein [Pelomonas sp. KK5]
MHARLLLLPAALLAAALAAQAQDAPFTRKPLPAGHPFIGSWRVQVPGTDCHEIYQVHADGTIDVTSGAQVSRSEFEMPDRPSPKGFYKWTDKIVRDNGKPDCSGEVMKLGDLSTNFIVFDPPRKQFLMCEAESLDSCVGPFKRLADDGA